MNKQVVNEVKESKDYLDFFLGVFIELIVKEEKKYVEKT